MEEFVSVRGERRRGQGNLVYNKGTGVGIG